jgi:hypothetical protein
MGKGKLAREHARLLQELFEQLRGRDPPDAFQAIDAARAEMPLVDGHPAPSYVDRLLHAAELDPWSFEELALELVDSGQPGHAGRLARLGEFFSPASEGVSTSLVLHRMGEHEEATRRLTQIASSDRPWGARLNAVAALIEIGAQDEFIDCGHTLLGDAARGKDFLMAALVTDVLGLALLELARSGDPQQVGKSARRPKPASLLN